MEISKFQIILVSLSLLLLLPVIHGWGTDGHFTVCRIAQCSLTSNAVWFRFSDSHLQPRLSDAASAAVKKLLPKSAGDDLASLCSWADHVKFRYHWSSALHFIDTPDSLCTYQYDRDCKDDTGEKGRCLEGAIRNYTDQLLSYAKPSQSEYNLTEALLFLSHFIGDVHQPLHVGFTSDKGGNTIDVHWYRRKSVLHHVWDTNMIETAEERFYNEDVEGMIDAIQQNITNSWSDQVTEWETCGRNETTCPDISSPLRLLHLPNVQDTTWKYATEGIKAACTIAYKDVTEDSTLDDNYFLSRLPEIYLRLAQGGVRLAATLNRIFG
ncbi:hypothetical protein Syun_021787 [Stephania yunnanensis]|uniref:Aspergillus nuclease S1 n=1 Tax=Stephania yunnanensis TaxID=152371 RepID=A0AAP0IH12_9MAGN